MAYARSIVFDKVGSGMDVNVFDVFDLSDYTFFKLSRGSVIGNVIDEQYEAQGVFKLRSDLVRGDNAETKDSNATLHIRPTEAFLAAVDNNLVGHGIVCQGKTYEIIGQTGGKNFHNGNLEHYTVTLQESDFSELEDDS